jgi:hypothetical protein
MLTGYFPRDFPTDKDPLLTLLQSQPVPINERDPSIPDKIAATIDASLSDKTSIVFRNAAEFKLALRGAL